MGALEMTSLLKLGAVAASRGEGLHTKLRELFERVAMFPNSEIRSRLATSFRGYVTFDGSSRT